MSISTKDLRDFFDEVTKKASDAVSDAKIPDIEIGRRDTTPGLLYFSIGLLFGALAGVVIAFLMTPFDGEEARQKLQEQVEKVRHQRDVPEPTPMESTNGSTLYHERPANV